MRALLLMGMLVGSFGAASAGADSPCMPISDARGVAVSGPRELLIDAGERAWMLTLASDCPAALGARKLRFVSSVTDRQICSARGDQVNADQTLCQVEAVFAMQPQVLQEALAVIKGRPAATAEPVTAEPVCFDPGAVRKWRQLDRRTLRVDVRRQGQFTVHLANVCSDLNDASDARFLPGVGRLFCGHKTDMVLPLRTANALGSSPRLLQSRIERQGCPVLRIERFVAPDPSP